MKTPAPKGHTPTFLKLARGDLTNLDAIARIEEQVTTRGTSAVLYDSAGIQLGVLPPPYTLPGSFIEITGATPHSVRSGDVRRVFVSLARVARIAAADPQGARQLFDFAGHLLGTAQERDLTAAGIV
jgi:hypothetical protein